MTKKNATQVKKLKLKLQSFYKVSPKEALAVYNALDWAHIEAEDVCYNDKTKKTLARLRDLAAVAIGKPTISQMEEEDY